MILLKSVTALPEIDCVAEPLKTTVPVPLLNVPLLVKLAPTLRVAGEFKVPLMVILLKFEEADPATLDVPLNTIVPVPAVNVPLFVHVPAIFSGPEGAISVPLIRILFSDEVLDPEIVVFPPKVTVEDPAFNVPLFTRLPLMLKFAAGVNVPVMVIAPKVGLADPDIVVVPENVEVLDVSDGPTLLTIFPLKSIGLLLELNPPDAVKIPLTVIALPSDTIPDPVMSRLASWVVPDGNSTPVEIGDEFV